MIQTNDDSAVEVRPRHALGNGGRIPLDWITSGLWASMPPAVLAVAGVLLAHANTEGRCWPSVSTIGTEAGIATGNVYKALNWLEQAHVLERRTAKGKRNIYQLRPAPRTPASPLAPVAGATPARMTPRASAIPPLTPARLAYKDEQAKEKTTTTVPPVVVAKEKAELPERISEDDERVRLLADHLQDRHDHDPETAIRAAREIVQSRHTVTVQTIRRVIAAEITDKPDSPVGWMMTAVRNGWRLPPTKEERDQIAQERATEAAKIRAELEGKEDVERERRSQRIEDEARRRGTPTTIRRS